jgi:hypothetical protein
MSAPLNFWTVATSMTFPLVRGLEMRTWVKRDAVVISDKKERRTHHFGLYALRCYHLCAPLWTSSPTKYQLCSTSTCRSEPGERVSCAPLWTSSPTKYQLCSTSTCRSEPGERVSCAPSRIFSPAKYQLCSTSTCRFEPGERVFCAPSRILSPAKYQLCSISTCRSEPGERVFCAPPSELQAPFRGTVRPETGATAYTLQLVI